MGKTGGISRRAEKARERRIKTTKNRVKKEKRRKTTWDGARAGSAGGKRFAIQDDAMTAGRRLDRV